MIYPLKTLAIRSRFLWLTNPILDVAVVNAHRFHEIESPNKKLNLPKVKKSIVLTWLVPCPNSQPILRGLKRMTVANICLATNQI